MIEAGNYGISLNDEAVNDLGSQIDIVPLGPQAEGHRHVRQRGNPCQLLPG